MMHIEPRPQPPERWTPVTVRTREGAQEVRITEWMNPLSAQFGVLVTGDEIGVIVACTGWVRVKKGDVVGYAPTAYLITERLENKS